ncbi:hypothetical protein BH11PSE3_BH11PSE3_04400 [soil metagenome]
MSYFRLPIFILPLVIGLGLLTGGCGVPLVVAGASYAADGGLLAASNKTSTDHMISMVSKQDCALWRVMKSRPVCQAREGDQDPYEVDYDAPQRMVGEDGVHYAPPLRPAIDAPATSWDATAYKAPPPATSPAAPVTAVADASRDPAPVIVADPGPSTASAAAPSSASSKAKKAKARSVKKPPRHPAAPAS